MRRTQKYSARRIGHIRIYGFSVHNFPLGMARARAAATTTTIIIAAAKLYSVCAFEIAVE